MPPARNLSSPESALADFRRIRNQCTDPADLNWLDEQIRILERVCAGSTIVVKRKPNRTHYPIKENYDTHQ